MPKKDNASIALDAYEQLADGYARLIQTKPHNAYYDRPATLSLLGNVAGMDMLDLGCGTGAYSAELLDRGAKTVTGMDVSPAMLAHAQVTLGSRVCLIEGSLEFPLPFENATFDAVVAGLCFDYVRDWRPLFREIARVLRPGGCVSWSMEHPGSRGRLKITDRYHAVELQSMVWKGFGFPVTVPSYRRPFEEAINPSLEAGLILSRLLEPRPTEAFKAADPRHYEELLREPAFLCLSARKPLAASDR